MQSELKNEQRREGGEGERSGGRSHPMLFQVIHPGINRVQSKFEFPSRSIRFQSQFVCKSSSTRIQSEQIPSRIQSDSYRVRSHVGSESNPKSDSIRDNPIPIPTRIQSEFNSHSIRIRYQFGFNPIQSKPSHNRDSIHVQSESINISISDSIRFNPSPITTWIQSKFNPNQ